MRNGEHLRLGLVGCGTHSQENLVPSLWSLPNTSVVAVCDLQADLSHQLAQRFPSCVTETTFEALLARRDIDAVIVAATPHVHYAAASLAISNGVHVFVEKPPTATKAELESLACEASSRGIVTGVGHNLRYATAAVEMQGILVDPPFGRPIAMEMRYLASKPKGDRWELKSPLRSFLLSHANHAIDFMIYQMGAIRRVNAAAASGPADKITLTAQFVFESGAVGTLLATSSAPHFSISGTIISDKSGVVQMNSLNEVVCFGIADDAKRWGRCWTSKTLQTGYDAAGYSTELQQFATAVRANDPDLFRPSFRDELEVYFAIDEIENRILNRTNL